MSPGQQITTLHINGVDHETMHCKVPMTINHLDVSTAVSEAFREHCHHFTMMFKQRRQLLTELQLTLCIGYLHNR